MLENHPCDLPEPIVKSAVTACGTCGEVYQVIEAVTGVTTLSGTEPNTVLRWVRMDELPEEERVIAPDDLNSLPLADRQLVKHEPAPAPEDEMPVRIEYAQVEPGATVPLQLDLGTDTVVLIQPKSDQQPGEVALNVIVTGGLGPEVAAWLMDLCSSKIVEQIQADQAAQVNGSPR